MLNTEDVIELLAIELLGIIPEDENVVISTNRGQPIALNGNGRAGQAFRNIARRLMGETVPLMSLEDRSGFFGRISRMIRPGGN
jgi:septum site-determining protein MinD